MPEPISFSHPAATLDNEILTTYYEHPPISTLSLTSGTHLRGLRAQCPRCGHTYLKRLQLIVDGDRGPEYLEIENKRLKEEDRRSKEENKQLKEENKRVNEEDKRLKEMDKKRLKEIESLKRELGEKRMGIGEALIRLGPLAGVYMAVMMGTFLYVAFRISRYCARGWINVLLQLPKRGFVVCWNSFFQLVRLVRAGRTPA